MRVETLCLMNRSKKSADKQCISGMRNSANTKHKSDWHHSDVSSDLTVEIGTASFSLHKFPLVSRSGKMRQLLCSAKDSKITKINLQTVPGGAYAFELAAKYCYGAKIEISLSNVAMLVCASHHLQMTEQFGDNNLQCQAEMFLKEIVIANVKNSLIVLHQCESLLPTAEEINLVSRIITAIATNVCREQLTTGLSKIERLTGQPSTVESEPPHDWWGKLMAFLSLNFFQRVLLAMKSQGLKQETVSRILIIYAHHSLQELPINNVHMTKEISSNVEKHEILKKIQKQIVNVEAMVSLLPNQSKKSPVPLAFLSRLLKTATTVSASTICKRDLERRIGMQLDKAILEDILIPTCSFNNDLQLYNTNSVFRIFTVFLKLDEENDDRIHFKEGDMTYEFDSKRSPMGTSILKVSRLMDIYLVEISQDSNMKPSKFIALAELLPDHARVMNDELYRAIDNFLKVHPNIKELDRYRLCKTINCKKLSQDVCNHAAQNEQLPIQMAIQILHFEQIRLRNAIHGDNDQVYNGSTNFQFSQRSNSAMENGAMSPRDKYALVRRENRELKLEVARMRMRLTDLEKDHVSMRQDLVHSKPAKNILRYFTTNLGKLNILFRLRHKKTINTKTSSEPQFLFQKQRRQFLS